MVKKMEHTKLQEVKLPQTPTHFVRRGGRGLFCSLIMSSGGILV